MTKQEILTQINNIRSTLLKDQSMMLEMQNHLLGCTMLLERLQTEANKLEDANPVTEKNPDA